MLKKVLKGMAFLVAVAAITGFAPKVAKADVKFVIMANDECKPADGVIKEAYDSAYFSEKEVGDTRVIAAVNEHDGKYDFVEFDYIDRMNGVEVSKGTITPDGDQTKGSYDKYCYGVSFYFNIIDGKPTLESDFYTWERISWEKASSGKHVGKYIHDMKTKKPTDIVLDEHDPEWDGPKGQEYCTRCGFEKCDHKWVNVKESCDDHGKKKEYTVDKCQLCGKYDWRTQKNVESKSEDKEEKKEEKKEEPKDANKEAFSGREASQLSVTEQKTAVSYAIDSLRASGNALAANVVTSNNGGNGKASDIAAVVADNRDAANQQIFAQVACANLGFKNVTPLATYNMYSLYSTYAAKNGAQVITWANTGLKAGDTAFVVWYNQKLGKIELLPALVDANGNVLVNVPALGDVSTMTVVKASK